MQLIKGTGKSDLSVPEQLISLSHNPVCRGEISAALFSDTKNARSTQRAFLFKIGLFQRGGALLQQVGDGQVLGTGVLALAALHAV